MLYSDKLIVTGFNVSSFGVDAAEEFKENMLSDYCCQAKLMLLINAGNVRVKDLQESKDPQVVSEPFEELCLRRHFFYIQESLFCFNGISQSSSFSAAKLLILNPNEFDLWKMRIEQYLLMTDYSLWEVIFNGDSPAPTKIIDGVLQLDAPTTAEQRLARNNKLKARGTLLMALPDKHQLKFNTYKDARTLMDAIEKKFRGNTKTKKEDINLKFLRSLPSDLRTHTLIWRNTTDLEEQSLDDLFNSLKIYKAEVKISAAASVSTISAKIHVFALPNVDSLSNVVIYSFFASQSNSPQLDNDDLKQIDADDLEEMDLKWKTDMLIVRARQFLQRTRRNLEANGPTSMGFDMSKVKCYNCHKKGHFARECRSPKDKRRNDEEPTNYALMAFFSSSSSSDNEVISCSKAYTKTYVTLQSHYDKMTEDYRKSQFNIISYQTGLESVEAILLVYQQNESVFEKDIKLLKLEVRLRDNALVVRRQNLEKAEQERDDLKLKLEKFQTSSKNLSELLASQTNDKTCLGYISQVFTRAMFDCDDYLSSGSDRYQSGNGYHVVPPPYTGTFMPPKPDLVFNNAPNDVETGHPAFNVKLSPSKPENDLSHTHRSSTPIIEDWVSDSEDESETKTSQNVPSFVQPTERVKTPRPSIKHVETSSPTTNSKTAIPKLTSNGKCTNRKAWHVVPAAVLTQSKLVPINAVRPVSIAVPKISVTRPRQAKTVVTKTNSPPRRHINRSPSSKANNFRPKVTAVKATMVNVAQGNPQHALKDKRVIDSGCLRHMTENMSYLSDFEELNGGYVVFGGNPKGGKISGKGRGKITGKASIDESNLWHMRLGPFNTMNKLVKENLVRDGKSASTPVDTEKPLLKDPDGEDVEPTEQVKSPRPSVQHVKISIPAANLKTASPKPKTNGKRKNRNACFVCKSLDHLIKDCDYHEKKMAQTTARNHAKWETHKQYTQMTLPNLQRHVIPTAVLTQSKIVPIIAVRPVSTAVPKIKGNPQHALKDKGVIDSGCLRNMTGNMSYLLDFEELNGRYVSFRGNPKGGKISRKGNMSYLLDFEELNGGYVFFRGNPKGGKFDRKVDDEFLVGYPVSSKAFRVFNSRTRIIQETLHVNFLENKPNVVEKVGEENIQQYVLFLVWSSGSTNPQNTDRDATFDEKEHEFVGRKPESEVNVSPSSSTLSKKHDDNTKRDAKGKSPIESLIGYRNLSVDTNTFSAGGPLNAVASPTPGKSSSINTSQYPDDPNMPELEDITYSDDEDDVGAETDFNNLETSITVSPIPTTRVHKDHPVIQIIGDLSSATQTRSMRGVAKDQGGLSQINKDDFHTCMFACFLSQEEPNRVHQALKDPGWIEAIQKELLQFKMQKVWVLVDLPQRKRAIEGINYEEVFAPVARIEAIRLFLAYASFMPKYHMVYLVKSAFLYGTIEEEVYVCQPPGFEDPDYPDKYCIDTKKPLLKDPDGKDVDVHTYRSMIGSLMYLTLSRPDIMFAVCACALFQVTPKASHLHAVKRIFRYLKGKPHLGLWYPKDSPFNLVAYSDSDYADARLDKKSTTGGVNSLDAD
nr:hypothetical protein [Tanacetum cinerariifolium]